MSRFELKDRNACPIEDWRNWTPPKQPYQWRAGRSAMELARAWFTSPAPQCPPEIQALLRSSSLTEVLDIYEGFPEFVTPLPVRGEGRNHDLMLRASQGDRRATICVEAKADESFGERIEASLIAAKAANPRTGLPDRVEHLLRIVFGEEARSDATPWSALRYQLLTGVAGTAIQAEHDGASVAVFIVHEFQTAAVDPDKVQENGSDYAQFVATLAGIPEQSVEPGRLYQSRHNEDQVPLLIGKAVYSWYR